MRGDRDLNDIEVFTHVVDAQSFTGAGKKLGIIAAIVLIILVFMIGRRRGAANRTVVEIRRV